MAWQPCGSVHQGFFFGFVVIFEGFWCFGFLGFFVPFFLSQPRGLSLNIILLTFITKIMELNSKPQTKL